MSTEIRVAPPFITMNQGTTFMVTHNNGSIESDGSNTGLYTSDTRFVSHYHFFINRQEWKAVNSNQLTFYAARYHLSNPAIPTEDGEITKYTVGLTIDRIISSLLCEKFEITNYAGKKVKFVFELALRSDFADIFEVREGRIVQKGTILTTWDDKKKQLSNAYKHKDFHCDMKFHVVKCDTPVTYANGRIYFPIELEPHQRWVAYTTISMDHQKNPSASTDTTYEDCFGGQKGTPTSGAVPHIDEELRSNFDKRQKRWQEICTNLISTNFQMYQMYQQAKEDMGALRIYDMDVSDDAWIAAAGIPWFVTLFGRDSLIVSYQNMAVSPGFARGALKRLAEYQAKECDDWYEAQPGKIMHELRRGELSYFHKIPFTPFYATADATILYLIVLSEAYRWTGDIDLLKEFRDTAEKCLQWIDQYGDLDGDGFQEWKSRSSYYYENVGWKDASDAVVYGDGSQVKQPKGTCELQSYVYDAKLRMAEIFDALNEKERAQTLRTQAEQLKRHFNEVFWMEDEGCYGFALDPEKKLSTAIASNAGQCLWNGIADKEKAARVAKRLLQDDMWNGWGIRTLSNKNPAYDPFAYQRGSIWPQDNAIIAAGFKRYGLIDEANQVIGGLFDAISHFDAYRPPEVFAGIRRTGKLDFPVVYPAGANIPQAWATGSIFHMVRTLLGLRADAPNKRLYVHPTLPSWLPDMTLQHLRVAHCTVDLHFWNENGKTRWEVQATKPDEKAEQIEVLDEPDAK